MESVLALEVGAAARRIFRRAIWEEGRDGRGMVAAGDWPYTLSPLQEGGTEQGQGVKTWDASLERD